MRTIQKLLILFLSAITAFSAFGQTDGKEYAAITTTLNYYLEGGTNNDFSTLKKAFHKDAVMEFISEEEGYKSVNALEFFEERMKPGPKANRKTYVTQINIMNTAANARLEIVFPDFVIVDYMNLLKIDGEWQIVSKIFSSRSVKTLFPE